MASAVDWKQTAARERDRGERRDPLMTSEGGGRARVTQAYRASQWQR